MKAYSHLSSVYDTLMSDVPYDRWIKYIVDMLKANEIMPDASVLDAGCGTGRIAIGLSRAGFSVTGMDISEEMLRMAEENARRAGQSIPFICQSVTEAALHQKTDAVTAVCDVVNYIDQSGLDAFFRSAGRIIRPGGMLIFDISSPDKLRRVIGDNIFFEDREDVTYIWTNVLNHDAVEMDIIMFVNNGDVYIRKEEQHTQYIHEPDMLADKLKACGFKGISMTDGYENKGIKEQTQRITFTAFKE